MTTTKIYLKENAITELPSLLKSLTPNLNPSKLFIVYDKALPLSLPSFSSLFPLSLLPLPGGEGSKSKETLFFLLEEMTKASLNKDSLVIAVGGGTITDLVGFAASIYHRGLPLIFIPTTLLGMVDAAIGGKNGINFLGLKNQIGTLFHPLATINDMSFLQTLDDKSLKEGLSEVIKYGIIQDKELFTFLDENMEKILAKDPLTLRFIVERSIENKLHVVKRSEDEPAYRDILNFGHTFAHAIEGVSQNKISHGEAVAIGMGLAMKVSERLQWCTSMDVLKVFRLLERAKLNLLLPNFDEEQILTFLEKDKKGTLGKINLILSKGIGYVAKANDVSRELLKDVLLNAMEKSRT